MPIADMTGAAANRIGVARDLGRYNQGQKDQLLGGVAAAGDIGASVVEAQHRTKMEQLLQEQGFDPATAKNLIAAGPHAAASALLQKKREVQQEAQRRATAEALGLAGGVNPATQHAGMGGGSGGAASQGRAPAFDNAGQPIAGASAPSGGGMDWGRVDPSAMEFLARQRADTAKTEGERKWYFQKQASDTAAEKEVRGTPTYGETQAEAQRKAFQEALKGASALAQQPFNLIGGPLPGATGMTVPVQRSETDIRRSMQQHGFDYRQQPTENIDPLSPAGVKAQREIIGAREDAKPDKAPTGDDQVIPPDIAAAAEKKYGLGAGALAGKTYRAAKLVGGDPLIEVLNGLRADREKTAAAEHIPPSEQEVFLSSLSIEDRAQYDRLKKLAEPQTDDFGDLVAPPPEAVKAYNDFVRSKRGATRKIGAGAGAGAPGDENLTPAQRLAKKAGYTRNADGTWNEPAK